MTAADAVLLCKALGDPVRFAVIGKLARDGETCACQLLEQFDITQPTLSHHMRILCACGLVNVRREGKWSHYSLSRSTLGAFLRFLESQTPGGLSKGVD